MSDVQINVSDVMTAFANENAALCQRAIFAEQKAKAWQARAEQLEEALDRLTPPEPTTDAMVAVAAADVKKPRATRSRA